MKKLANKLIENFGYSVVKTEHIRLKKFSDIKEHEFWDIYQLCKPYTMTSIERMYALYNAVLYVLHNNIKGDFVECGVWRGGSSMLVARMMSNRKITDRKIFLYDTFEGMSEPTSNDFDLEGNKASDMLAENEHNKSESVWCLADIADVRHNLSLTGFNQDSIIFVKGKVEDTLPDNLPGNKIALLRLDTDWYESTKHELEHLYPELSVNGALIIDDYGHWEGCKKAVDEYFKENSIGILLHRVDYTGRMGIKPFQ
jgi:O-methyltransferase